MKRIVLVVASAMGLAAAPVLAQDLPEIADSDGNGLWSLAEMQTVYPDLTSEAFGGIDANADGGVDRAELEAAVAGGKLTPSQN